jgi:ATP-dependent helicase YprA (DUF1998 family)
VTVLDTFESSSGLLEGESSRAPRANGEVHVVSRVVGFKKIKFYTNENVGSGDLDLPEQQMHTTAYWLTIPADVLGALPYAADDRRDGVVGLSFALGQIAQLLLMCERHDIGISIDAGEPDGSTPRIFIYDNYPGGIGFSKPLFRMHEELLEGRQASDCRVRVRETGARGASARSATRSACEGSGASHPQPADGTIANARWRTSAGAIDVSLADRVRGILNRRRPSTRPLSHKACVQTEPLKPPSEANGVQVQAAAATSCRAPNRRRPETRPRQRPRSRPRRSRRTRVCLSADRWSALAAAVRFSWTSKPPA